MTVHKYYKNGKKKKAKQVKCKNCGNIFIKALTEIKRRPNNFCSRKCFHEYSTKKGNVILECDYCKKSFSRVKSKVNVSYNFCSKKCLDMATRIGSGKKFDDLRPKQYRDGSTNYREKACNYYPKKCNRCGFSNEFALVVHHKDKNRKNNSIENLEILCANCHAIEHRGVTSR